MSGREGGGADDGGGGGGRGARAPNAATTDESAGQRRRRGGECRRASHRRAKRRRGHDVVVAEAHPTSLLGDAALVSREEMNRAATTPTTKENQELRLQRCRPRPDDVCVFGK